MSEIDPESILESLFLAIPVLRHYHAPGSEVHAFLQKVARTEIKKRFNDESQNVKEFKPFGDLSFPFHNMGAVTSLNLFDIDELILFSFYWMNRQRYHRVLDIGANIGLHSIILSKCGYQIRAYEPDPRHVEILLRNLELNYCGDVEVVNHAVSNAKGRMEFVRVLGNTTGSHLAGSKANPYGELERFPVEVESINGMISWADLMKIDVEGHEKDVLLATREEDWLRTDALVEVGSKENAIAIYNHFSSMRRVNLFSQKKNWQRVDDLNAMPVSYHEGTLFISSKSEMPWTSH